MTKFVADSNHKRSRFHTNPECSFIKNDSREASMSEIEWKDLDPCPRCCDE